MNKNIFVTLFQASFNFFRPEYMSVSLIIDKIDLWNDGKATQSMISWSSGLHTAAYVSYIMFTLYLFVICRQRCCGRLMFLISIVYVYSYFL